MHDGGSTCSFCAEIDDVGVPLHQEMIPDSPRKRILIESEGFVVVPSIGPLSVGHLLIVPRAHVLGTLHLGSERVAECDGLVSTCVRRLRSLYSSSILLFEHGSALAGTRRSSACVEHAHLHVLPGPRAFVLRVQAWLRGSRAGRDLTSVRGLVEADAYLLVGEANSELCVAPSPVGIPSQFLRQHYALAAGTINQWDWRSSPGKDLFLRTIEDWNGLSAGLSTSES